MVDDATINQFLDELESPYRKYDLSLGREDRQGAFTIEKLSETNIIWVRDARRYALSQ